MIKFSASRAKTYSYLTDSNDEDKKSKGTKNVSWKEKISLNIINII